MTESRGKHESGSSSGFYRDLAMMVLGILALGAAVFFLLFLLADNPDGDPSTTPVAAETTVTTDPSTTVSTSETTSTSSTTTTPASTTVPVRPAEEVRVVVLNSMGLAGAAGRITERLEEAGYQTLQADDYEPELDPSRIWYREGFSAEANVLLKFLPDAVVQPLEEEDLEEGADVIMILGSGYEE